LKTIPKTQLSESKRKEYGDDMDNLNRNVRPAAMPSDAARMRRIGIVSGVDWLLAGWLRRKPTIDLFTPVAGDPRFSDSTRSAKTSL
jgi:hypothetical protein